MDELEKHENETEHVRISINVTVRKFDDGRRHTRRFAATIPMDKFDTWECRTSVGDHAQRMVDSIQGEINFEVTDFLSINAF